MAEYSDILPSALDLEAHITALTTQFQENTNKFLALEEENATLLRENLNISKRLSAVETTPRSDLRFQVPIPHMQPLGTPELGNSLTQPSSGTLAVQSINHRSSLKFHHLSPVLQLTWPYYTPRFPG